MVRRLIINSLRVGGSQKVGQKDKVSPLCINYNESRWRFKPYDSEVFYEFFYLSQHRSLISIGLLVVTHFLTKRYEMVWVSIFHHVNLNTRLYSTLD